MSEPEGDPRPIGVFDSGVGGLTVVRALEEKLPGEAILYLGDTARLPYGTKSPTTVRHYTERNVAFLIERGVKAIVVACNTASALALPDLVPEVPTWGVVEPGAARAAALTGGRIGVIATESTIESAAYERSLRRLAPQVEVSSVACPLFVPLVEAGWEDDPITEAIARRYLQPLVDDGIDTLVLGCTHYPLLAPLLQRVVGVDVTLVDSGAAVAETAAAELTATGRLRGGSTDRSDDRFFVTDSSTRFERIARHFLGRDGLSLEWVDVV